MQKMKWNRNKLIYYRLAGISEQTFMRRGHFFELFSSFIRRQHDYVTVFALDDAAGIFQESVIFQALVLVRRTDI